MRVESVEKGTVVRPFIRAPRLPSDTTAALFLLLAEDIGKWAAKSISNDICRKRIRT
jgi:hypothetical protein